MRLKKTIRIDDDSSMKLASLVKGLNFKSENQFLIKMINEYYNKENDTVRFFNSIDRVESVLFNDLNLMLKSQAEIIAKNLNYINHNQEVIKYLLEITMHTIGLYPKSPDNLASKIASDSKYKKAAELLIKEKFNE